MTYFPAPEGGPAIPQPARSLLFPAPTAFQNPMFGVDPYKQGNIYTPGTYGIDPALGLPDLQTRAAQQAQMMQLAQLSSMGLAPDTDPHTWTAEEAARQTDQAIAKIATVDPEAAERLAEQRAPQEDSGDGFWDSLKEVAGDILAPGLELGGRILDIVGRTANIVPNLAFDVVNGGDFNFFDDVGGALSGNMRHNWNSVFQEMGWEGDGVGGFLRATFGLVGDIATDPLTWLIPAGAGKKAADAAADAGRTAATRSETLLERAKSLYGQEGDDLVRTMETNYDTLVKGARQKGWKPGGEGDDIINGLIGEEVLQQKKDLLSDMLLISDRTYRAVESRSFATFARGKAGIVLSDGSKLQPAQIKSILEQVIKEGSHTGSGLQLFADPAWKRARALASSVGGTRLKVNLPFTNLRYISPAIPYSKLATEKTVGFATRMLAGQSGMNRMVAAIGKGEGTWKDLTNWMEGGFNKAFDANPDMVRNLRGKYKNMGSMFYSASDSMGSITAHLSSGSKAQRAGLAGYWAHAQKLEAQSAFTRMVREVAYQSKGVSGKRRDRQQYLREVEATLGVSFRKKGQTATPEQMRDMARYLDWFPSDLDAGDLDALDAWFWAKPENAPLRARQVMPGDAPYGQHLGADEVAKAENKLAQMHEVVERLDPKQRELLRDTQEMWHGVRNEAAKRDAVMADLRHNFERAGLLVPRQADEWQLGSHELLTQDFFLDVSGDAGRANRVRYNGVAVEDARDHDGIFGIRVSRTSGGGAGVGGAGQVKMRARGADFIIIDETQGATFSDEALINELRDGADTAAANSHNAAVVAVEGSDLPAVTAKEQAEKSARMTTEALQKKRPDAKGVMYKRANGDVEIVMFDPSDVKVISDSAAHLVPSERGYYRRTLTKKMKEWLRGAVPEDERQVLIVEGELEAFLSRQTIGMDLDEAEDFIRNYIGDVYGTKDLPDVAWNTNMLEVHEEYLDHVGTAVASEMLGNASRRMVALGDLQPALFGSTPRSAKYEWMLHPSLVKNLAKKDAKLTKAILAMHELDAKRLEEQHARLNKVAEEYGMFNAMVEEALVNGTEVPSRFVQAVRRHGETVAKAETAVRQEIEGIDTARVGLEEQVHSYDAALAEVADDPAYGHPKAGQPVAVRQNADGTQTVRGWHFSESFSMAGGLEGEVSVDDIIIPKNVRGEEMSSSGFHFGGYDQAISRANDYAMDMGKSIGHRGQPDTWPASLAETPVGGLPGGPEEYGGLMNWLDESREAGVPVSWVIDPAVDRPDIYYDEVMFPVEATGNFQGGAGGRIPGEGPLEEGGLGDTFIGSERGATSEKAADRKALTDAGFTGSLYTNEVEGMGIGPSVVVLEPTDVIVSRPTQRFADDVAAGKLYRQPDGSVSARRTAGSRKLQPRDASVQQLDEMATRRSELEGLRRNLTKGADEVVPNTAPGRRPRIELPDAMAVGKKYPVGRNAGKAKLAMTVKHKGQGQFEFQVGDSSLGVQLTAEGDLQVFGTEVAEGMRRQGVATEMYVAAAELADKYGGRLVSDKAGSRSPDAEKLWRALSKKGFDVAEEETEDGLVYVLRHNALPSTRKVAESGEAVARTATLASERLGQNMLAAGKRLERLRRQTQVALSETNKQYAEFHGARAALAPALTRIETAGELAGMTRLRVPGLEGYAMPSYIAAEFHAAIDQYGAQGLQKAWRTYVMGPWKRWATYRWPGFHVRNFFGAFFNNWLGGVTMQDYVFSWRVNHARDGSLKWASKEVDDATIQRLHLQSHFGKHKPTYADIAELTAEHSIGRANTLAVMGIETASQNAQEVYHVVGHKNPNVFRRAARKFDAGMREAGSSVEDFHRIAAWSTGMTATAGDTYGARAFVMMRHGDYSDLTHAEQYIKDVIPFYKWMRTNVPYQIRMLAENPAKLSLVHDKLKRYAFEAQGLDYEKSQLQMPDYLKESLAVPIPSWVPVVGSKGPDALKFAMFDLPYADLYNGLDEYMSSALPIGRNVLESYGFKQTLFSGTPLNGTYKPLSGVFNVPGIRDILHAARLTKRGADGQEYIEDKLQNVLLAWPIFSRFRNFTESSPERVDSRVGGLFSMMAGVGIKQGDYTNAELDFFYNEVQPLLDQYRSLGIQLPTVEDFQSGHVGAQVGLFGAQEEVASPLFAAAA